MTAPSLTADAVRGLLPCPFCGGRAERIEITEDDGFENRGGGAIECQSCLASSHVEFVRMENLLSSWNRRSPDWLRQEARIKALEEALRPLADMAAIYDHDDIDGNDVCWSSMASPRIEHLRAARAALNQTEG